MKKLIKPGKRTVFSTAVCVVLMMLIIISSCRKSNVSKNDLRNFEQVNLVANNGTYHPVLTDPTLMNAWGLAWVMVSFAVLCVVAIGFVYKFLPETKGRSVEEVVQIFEREAEASKAPV